MRQPAPLSVFRLSGDDRLLLSRFFVRRSGGAECQSAKNACRAQSAERDVPVAFGPHRLRRTGGNGATCFGRMCGIACRVMPVVRRRPHAGPAPLSVFGCPGAAARISPQARAFPPRCRTAGPCAFLTEGRSGRSLRNAPRGRDLGRRMNRGPHGSEEPRSAAAFRNRPDSLSGRQTIPTGPLRNDSERLSKRSCETPKQNPGCTESPRHKPATIPKEPGNVHEIRLQCLRRQERFLPRNGGGASSRQTAKPPRSVSFQLHFVENYRPMRIILQ